MIVHVVLFQPREHLSDSAQAAVLEDLRRAAAAIPSIRRFRIGRRMTHGLPGYEQTMRDNYEFAALLEFDDRGGLVDYLRHPSHQSLAAYVTIAAQRALAYDYELEDVAH